MNALALAANTHKTDNPTVIIPSETEKKKGQYKGVLIDLLNDCNQEEKLLSIEISFARFE